MMKSFAGCHSEYIIPAMSRLKNVAIASTGEIGTPIIKQLLINKSNGTVDHVVVLTRQCSTPSFKPWP